MTYSGHFDGKTVFKKVNCFSPAVQCQIFKTNQMLNQILGFQKTEKKKITERNTSMPCCTDF